MKKLSCATVLVLAGLLSSCLTTQKLLSFTRDLAVGIYQATAQQIRLADQRAASLFDKMPAAEKKALKDTGTRYLAVRTSDPTPEQWKEIRKDMKKPSSRYGGPAKPAPSKLYCIMLWDTQTREVVGTNCYAVTALPTPNEPAKFDTYTAQYVGVF